MWLHLGFSESNVPVLGHCDVDLFSRIIVSRAYILYYLRKDSKFWFMGISLDNDMSRTILGHCDHDLCPSFGNNRVWKCISRI